MYNCPGDCDVVAAPDSISSSLTDNLTQVCYAAILLLYTDDINNNLSAAIS